MGNFIDQHKCKKCIQVNTIGIVAFNYSTRGKINVASYPCILDFPPIIQAEVFKSLSGTLWDSEKMMYS